MKSPTQNQQGWALPALLLASLVSTSCAEKPSTWQDPSNHTVQFVTVEKDVQLEVLDWGGTGRPVVLLAGLGNTAHVYDDFAERLSETCHVYGITRRGYGASTHANSGYTVDRRVNDVLQVLDALKLVAPVLVGHSSGGPLLSKIADHLISRC